MTSPSYCCSGLAPQRKNFGDYEGSLRTGSVMEVIWKHRQVLSSVKFHFFPPTFQWAGFVSGLVRIGPVRRFRSRLCTWHHQGVPGLQGCTWPHHSVQPSIHLHTRILNYPSFSLNLCDAANFKRRMWAFMFKHLAILQQFNNSLVFYGIKRDIILMLCQLEIW